MTYPPDQPRTEPADGEQGRGRGRKLDKHTAAKHGGGVLGALIGGLLKTMVAKLILAAVIAVLAYFGVARVAHLPSMLNPGATLLKPHSTVSATAVMTKLTAIEQVHVASATFAVNVQVTQSVGIIPCALICNQMQMQGTGTDDAIVDLSTLSPGNVEVNSDRSSVTVWIKPPAIGPAVLDPANCTISDGHGILNTPTQGLHSNPNGYRPLFAEGEAQIHDQAVRDQKLLAAGEQSTRELLARVLATIGVRQVTVTFV